MRGWFDLVSAASAETSPPTCRAIVKKRLKGFEPSTFCMAIRPISDLCRQRICLVAGISQRHRKRPRSGNACGYAPICSHSGTHVHECPKPEVVV